MPRRILRSASSAYSIGTRRMPFELALLRVLVLQPGARATFRLDDDRLYNAQHPYSWVVVVRFHASQPHWRQCLPYCQSIHNCGQDLPVNAHFIVINIAGKAFQYMTIDSSDNVALVNLECQSRVNVIVSLDSSHRMT